MPRSSRVRLFKQAKIKHKWALAAALFDTKGRVRKDRVVVNGREENHPEGSYFIEWWDRGQRHREAVGPHAQDAAEKARIKQAELAAMQNGIIPQPQVAEVAPERTTLAAALDGYKEYVQYHRSLRTFRTYRPILESFKQSCTKKYVDEVERQDFVDFATQCMKEGQKGKSIYNKLVVLSQVMKQHGRSKLLNTSDWPKFVETVRPIYEDAELKTLFEACTPAEEVRFKFYLMSGFRDAEGRFVTWRDVDFKHMAVRVTAKPHWGFHPKNWEEREVPVPEKLIALLTDFRPLTAGQDDPVFPSETGKPDGAMLEKLKAVAFRTKLNCRHCITTHKLKDGTTKVNRCADGPYCGRWFLHKFRHTYATRHLQDGIDIRTLQQWMGHRDIGSTMVYLKGVRNRDIQARINKGSLAAFA
ncbi:MAG TPA: site-specific integrase [Terriglobales bacterium]|nr:site-specific integrase [Terriglobales bacterium]